jgi:hypothetical protein
MDGGTRQEAMGEKVKREVKDRAYLRRSGRVSVHESMIGDTADPRQEPPVGPATNPLDASLDQHSDAMDVCPKKSASIGHEGPGCPLTGKRARDTIVLGRSDTVLLTFHIEHLLPFLFPF